MMYLKIRGTERKIEVQNRELRRFYFLTSKTSEYPQATTTFKCEDARKM